VSSFFQNLIDIFSKLPAKLDKIFELQASSDKELSFL